MSQTCSGPRLCYHQIPSNSREDPVRSLHLFGFPILSEHLEDSQLSRNVRTCVIQLQRSRSDFLNMAPMNAEASEHTEETSGNASETASIPISTVNLDQQSDLKLVVGAPTTNIICISSRRLCEVSKVFDRRLSGHFAEAQAVRSIQNPQTLELLNDDGLAVSDLCHLLYHDSTPFAESPNAERLYRLVKAADYYELLKPFEMQIATLATGHFKEMVAQEAINLVEAEEVAFRIGAAYFVKGPGFIARAAAQAIACYKAPISSLRKMSGGSVPSHTTLLALAEKRLEMEREFAYHIEDLRPKHTPAGCQCQQTFEEQLVKVFGKWPVIFGPETDEVTLWSVINSMRKVDLRLNSPCECRQQIAADLS